MAIPQPILSKLQELEPDASFEGNLPRVRSSSGSIYFAKVGAPREEEQYAGEAESLKAISSAAPSLAPRVFCSGVTESGTPYFISEYKDIGSLTSPAASVLAKRMATELHAKSSPTGKFGFATPTYCGVTKLSNGWFDRWDECYASMIGDLLDQLRRKGSFEHLCRKGERVKNEVIPKLLGGGAIQNRGIWSLTYVQGPIDTQPVILHGDLWSGNAGVDTATGQPIIFDPASYYGHNEADLSIARIFGGFPESFFRTYHEFRPKAQPMEQYDLRMDLYELFHYLNHTLIFGGSYAGSAERKMDTLISAHPRL